MPVKTTLYTYDTNTRRWRKNGKYSKPPTARQLRADKLGRPIDAKGRRVPIAALATAPSKPRKAKAPTKPTKPRKAPKAPSKPRKVTPKAPTKSRKKPVKKARKRPKKRAGEYITEIETLRAQLAEAQALLALPPLKPRPEFPKRYTTVPHRARVEHLAEGARKFKRPLMSSRYNLTSPSEISGIVDEVLKNKSAARGLVADDILIYEHGIQLVNTSQSGRIEATSLLVDKLAREYPQFAFKYSEDSVYVSMGDAETPLSRGTVKRNLNANKAELQDIFFYLSDLWDGDVGWFFIAENDDIEGGS